MAHTTQLAQFKLVFISLFYLSKQLWLGQSHTCPIDLTPGVTNRYTVLKFPKDVIYSDMWKQQHH